MVISPATAAAPHDNSLLLHE